VLAIGPGSLMSNSSSCILNFFVIERDGREKRSLNGQLACRSSWVSSGYPQARQSAGPLPPPQCRKGRPGAASRTLFPSTLSHSLLKSRSPRRMNKSLRCLRSYTLHSHSFSSIAAAGGRQKSAARCVVRHRLEPGRDWRRGETSKLSISCITGDHPPYLAPPPPKSEEKKKEKPDGISAGRERHNCRYLCKHGASSGRILADISQCFLISPRLLISRDPQLIMQLLQALMLATTMVAVHGRRASPTRPPTTSSPTAIDPGTFKVRTVGNCDGAT